MIWINLSDGPVTADQHFWLNIRYSLCRTSVRALAHDRSLIYHRPDKVGTVGEAATARDRKDEMDVWQVLLVTDECVVENWVIYLRRTYRLPTTRNCSQRVGSTNKIQIIPFTSPDEMFK